MTEKTTAAKLQIKPGYAVYFAGVPDAADLVGDLPSGATVTDDAGTAAAAVVFVATGAELDAKLGGAIPLLASATAVWLSYPKGNRSDVNRDSIRLRAETAGWEVVSNVSINETWSALRIKQTR